MPSVESKKERIMETSRRLFMSHGFRRVSMDEIARGAGVGKGTIYQLFESKQELMLSTIDFISEKMESAARDIINDEALAPTEKLKLSIKTFFTGLSPLRSEALRELETDFPQAYEKIQEKRREVIIGSLVGLFREGKLSGIYDPRLDEVLAAHVVVGAVDHISQADVLSSLDYMPDQLFKSVLFIVLKGCLTPEYRRALDGTESPKL